MEKESLRVAPDGTLSRNRHPAALGSALTHPSITTDFSESQIELITGVHEDIEGALRELTEIHRFVLANIGDELLWCTSMPCRLPPDAQIPIGQYGSSNVGRTKTVYRIGLSHRYGSRMQTISGLHYNFSLPAEALAALQQADGDGGDPLAYRDAAYFSLIRNFRRDSWLLLYLFGASPAVCRSFVDGTAHRLQPLGDHSMYLPHATSLRMGPLGYQSDAQSALGVSFNCLASYSASLREALTRPYPPYEAIGIRDGDRYRQLTTSLLQIENEFYGTIRPKQPIRRGERPLHALAERGVEYVEVRLMDLDPFSPVGITAETMRLLDVFLLHCLLADSPPDDPASIAALSRNRHRVAQQGRAPGLTLERDDGSEVALVEWGRELLADCAPIAAALDAAHPDRDGAYGTALAQARRCLDDPAATPSARVLAQIGGGDSPAPSTLAQSSLAHSSRAQSSRAQSSRAQS
ncbi:MAG: glutamate--cysteine ligase, partial [Lautropia sp.]